MSTLDAQQFAVSLSTPLPDEQTTPRVFPAHVPDGSAGVSPPTDAVLPVTPDAGAASAGAGAAAAAAGASVDEATDGQQTAAAAVAAAAAAASSRVVRHAKAEDFDMLCTIGCGAFGKVRGQALWLAYVSGEA